MAMLTTVKRLPAAIIDAARDAVTSTRNAAAVVRDMSTAELLTHTRSAAWRLLRSRKARMIMYTLVACVFAVASNVTTTFTATEYASRGFLITLAVIALDWLVGVAARGIRAAARKLTGSSTVTFRALSGRGGPTVRRNVTTRRAAPAPSERVKVDVRAGDGTWE